MEQIVLSSLTKEEIKELVHEAVRSEFHKISDELRPEELISRKETADILQISLVTLNKYSKKGILPSYKIGSRVRYKRHEVLDALNKLRIPGTKCLS